MSVRQGTNIIAGGIQVDNTPTSGSNNAVSSGGVYTALSGKVDTGHQVIDFQDPTSANGYTWYRKYADGWVEMGGRIEVAAFSLGAGSTKNVGNVTFPVTVSFVADIGFGDNMIFFNVHARNYTTTGMGVNVSSQLNVSYNQGNCYVFWKIKGIAAN